MSDRPEAKAAEEISKHKADLLPLLMPTCAEDKQTAITEIGRIIRATLREHYGPLLKTVCTKCRLENCAGCPYRAELAALEEKP